MAQLPLKVINKCDLVICLDCSASMVPEKNGVINNIDGLVDELILVKSINWRFALLGFTFIYHKNKHNINKHFFQIKNFTNNIGDYKNSFNKLNFDGQENTLIAIDRCLDLKWKNNTKKVLLVITNEPIESNWEPNFQGLIINDLIKKILNLGVFIMIYTPKCEIYKKLAASTKGFYCEIEKNNLKKQKFHFSYIINPEMLISTQKIKNVKTDIYNVKNFVVEKYL